MSAASRPYTRTRIGGPSGRVATTIVEPVGWVGASSTEVVATPSSLSAASTWAVVGRPAGEPRARCIAAATPQPSATAPTTASTPPMPSTSVPGTTTSSMTWLKRRTGRVRNGPATKTTAARTARRTVGNPLASSPPNTCPSADHTPSPSTANDSPRARTHASTPVAVMTIARRRRRDTSAAMTASASPQRWPRASATSNTPLNEPGRVAKNRSSARSEAWRNCGFAAATPTITAASTSRTQSPGRRRYGCSSALPNTPGRGLPRSATARR